MTAEHWQELRELYHAVMDAQPSRRGALLKSADPDVRGEVESLLSQSDSGTSPLDRGLLPHAAALLRDELKTSLQEGAHLDQYQIRAFLGRGGMGEVYLAHD